MRVINISSTWSNDDTMKHQKEDIDIALIYAICAKKQNSYAEDVIYWAAAAKRYWQERPRLVIADGVLKRRWNYNN